MVKTAAYLTDNVLPIVPLRQWVLSVPKRIRYLFSTHRETVGAVLRIFMRALDMTLRRNSPGAPADARLGGDVPRSLSSGTALPPGGPGTADILLILLPPECLW